MEILEMIGWITVGFLPTLGMLELSYQMGRVGLLVRREKDIPGNALLNLPVWLKTVNK
jgi:hypothetical protein